MSHPRPLSPHLQIYKPQITSVLSILHRFTGVALSIGTIVLVWWLVAASQGTESIECFQSYMTSWYGQIALYGWTFCFYYHLSNGIRHLFWDAGRGFELEDLHRSGWIVVISSIALTCLTLLWAVTTVGGA